MTLPRITIITPCLNQAPFIERTLCSVLDQGYGNLEYFVVDGGSTDGTARIMERYRDRLAWSSSRPDAGSADAINRALRHATGDIVGVLPGDDVYLPDALHTVARAMSDETTPPWLVGQAQRLDEYDLPLGDLSCAAPHSLASYVKRDSGFLPTCTTFIRRETFRRFGWFDRSLMLCADYDYHCRMLADGVTPRETPCVLAGRREHPNQLSSRHVWRRGIEHLAVAHRHAANLPLRSRLDVWRNCDERERIYAMAVAESHGQLARRFLWRQVVRRPWWLTHSAMRHALWSGVEHVAPPLEPWTIGRAA